MSTDFAPLETLQAARRYWWLLAALMVLGALIGLGYTALQPPVYEAQVTFSIGIDYTRTGVMTQYDQDMALGMAGNQIRSTELAEQVSTDAQAAGIPISAQELLGNSFIERKIHSWTLRVRHPNPESAAFLVNRWAELATDRFEDGFQHALKLESLEAYARSLESCMEQVVVEAPAARLCNPADLTALQAEMAAVQQAILTEKQATRNIFPGLMFQGVTEAPIPSRPALFDRTAVMLAGAFIGLIVGFWLVFLRLPERVFSQR